jgi:hypothetical protein
MVVVINDFEVIAEPAPAPRSTPAAEGADAEPAAVWTTHDIEEIMHRQANRAARVRAD